MDTYLEPDKSFVELRDMAKSGAIDLLREFSEPAVGNLSRCVPSNFDARHSQPITRRPAAIG